MAAVHLRIFLDGILARQSYSSHYLVVLLRYLLRDA
jgi:hypothetical protein